MISILGHKSLNDMNMKTIYRHFAAAVALVAAVSCTKQEEMPSQEGNGQAGTYEYILDATQEGITRTTMDGLSILWSKDDQIGVCSMGKTAQETGGPQSIVDAETYTPSVTASFALSLPDGSKPRVVGYPYSDNIAHTRGEATSNVDVCSVDIPAEQTGNIGNIPSKSFAMVGKINQETGECRMLNIGAVIKFEITATNITSLRFEGNNNEAIAGTRYYYTHDGGGKIGGCVMAEKDTETSTATSVTLLPSGTVFEPGEYYFVVGQNTLANGFTMTLTNSRGLQAVRKTEGEFTIERNHKYTKFGSDEGWFSNVSTGVAGNLGTADGTTATLYGIAPATATDADILGFQTSTDGINWTDYIGTIERRFATDPVTNVFTGKATGLVPEEAYYYRAAYTNSIGVTTYGKAKEFRTYSNAYSAIIDLYNGAAQWPFTNIEHGSENGLKIGTGSDALHAGEEFTLTNSTYDSFIVKANGGAWINKNTGCLTMRVYKGNYIKLPVFDGKKPVSVSMLMGGVEREGGDILFNQQGRPSVRKIGEGVFESSDVNGGDAWVPQSMYLYDSHSWYLNGTAAGEYGIYFNRGADQNCYIAYLEVVYADANAKPAKIDNHIVSCTNYGMPGNGAWPFDQGRSNWPNNYEFSTALKPDIKYSFPLGEPSYNPNPGLIIQPGHCMQFHAVEGYRLSYIKIRGYTDPTIYTISPNQDGTNPLVDSQQMSTTIDSILEFDLTGSAVNTDYYLVPTSKRASIREMWVTYELVK